MTSAKKFNFSFTAQCLKIGDFEIQKADGWELTANFSGENIEWVLAAKFNNSKAKIQIRPSDVVKFTYSKTSGVLRIQLQETASFMEQKTTIKLELRDGKLKPKVEPMEWSLWEEFAGSEAAAVMTHLVMFGYRFPGSDIIRAGLLGFASELERQKGSKKRKKTLFDKGEVATSTENIEEMAMLLFRHNSRRLVKNLTAGTLAEGWSDEMKNEYICEVKRYLAEVEKPVP